MSWPGTPPRAGLRPTSATGRSPAYVDWLMDRDRKSPGLKLLQGLIWERGYQAGELRGEVYPDVAPAIRRWRDAGIVVAIYSSGSELAQRLLFESTPAGDLTPLLSGFFDTAVGAKTSVDSYTHIAQRLGEPPNACLFISDVTSELNAARAAGFATVLSLRPGNVRQPDAAAWPAIHELRRHNSRTLMMARRSGGSHVWRHGRVGGDRVAQRRVARRATGRAVAG